MHIIRLALSFFGVKYVILTSFRGERKIRRVKFVGKYPYASWYGFGIRDVYLLDKGRLGNGMYVESWEPYEPKLLRVCTFGSAPK